MRQALLGLVLSVLAPLALGQTAAMPLPGLPSGPTQAVVPASGLEVTRASLELEPITADDLAGGAVHAQAAPQLTAVASGPRRLAVRGRLPVPPLKPVVRRKLPGVWRVGYDPAKGEAPPRVEVRVEGFGGQPGLTHEDGATVVPVRVVQNQAVASGKSGDTVIVEGDIVIEIPTAALQSAGRYHGQLVLQWDGT